MPTNSRFVVAVHILTLLALTARDKPQNSTFIAGSINTNPVVVRRLMAALVQAGLVVATAGRNGGFQLSRCPNEISLADVYRAVEHDELFSWHPQPPNQNCPVGANLHGALAGKIDQVKSTLEAELAKTRLSDLEHALAAPKPKRQS